MSDKKVTGAQVRSLIEARFQQEADERAFMDKVRDIVASFDGKQLNKRIATKLEKDLGCLVSMEKNYSGSGFTLYLWGDNIGRRFDNRLMAFFNLDHYEWKDKGPLTFAQKFELSNPAHYRGADERQEQRTAALASDLPEQYAAAVNQFRDARSKLAALVAYKQPLDADEYALRNELIGKDVRL